MRYRTSWKRQFSRARICMALAIWGFTGFFMPMQAEAAPAFSAATNLGTSGRPTTVTTADFNHDGHADIAVADESGADINVFFGDGAGGFTNGKGGFVPLVIPTPAPKGLTSADFNGDGKPDLAVTKGGATPNHVRIFLGDGAGGFAAVQTTPTVGNGPLSVTSADFNGDKNPDLAVANEQSNKVTVLFGSGKGCFSTTVTSLSAGTNPESVTSADFNRDGKPDLAVASNDGNVRVFLNTGATSAFPTSASSSFTAGTPLRSVTSADFNGDNNPDLAVVGENKDVVTVFMGDSTGAFLAAGKILNLPSGSGPRSVTSADFNGDGRPDLAVANSTSGTVSVLLNTSIGTTVTFIAATGSPFTVGSNPFSVTGADFNGDGDPDLAVANVTSNTVSVLLNKLGTTAPTGTISIDVGKAATKSTSVTLTLKCSGSCSQVQLSNDNTAWHSLAYAGSKLWTLASGADGVRTVYARFIAAGHLSTAVNDTIKLDTVAPAKPVIISPANDTVTNNTARPTISGTAEAGASVTVKDGGTFLGLVKATSSGSWSLPGEGAGTLASTVHSFIAVATDQADNVGPLSTAITYTVDTTLPTNQNTVLAGSVTVAVAGGGQVAIASSGTASNNVWLAPAGTTSFATGPTMTRAASGTATSITVPATDGTYKLFVLDAAGNVSIASTATVTVDTTAPVITLTGNNPVTLKAGATYTDAGATAVDLVDGKMTGSITVVNKVPNPATGGVYTVIYKVTDAAGHVAQATRKVRVAAVATTRKGSDDLLTLAGTAGGTVDIVSTGEALFNVKATVTTAKAPADTRFPFGLIDYSTSVTKAGSRKTVHLTFSAPLPAHLVVYKVDAGSYTLLPTSVWKQIDAHTIDVTLTDGDPHTDLDGTANAVIHDPLAIGGTTTPVVTPGSSGGGGSRTPILGGGGGCALNTMEGLPDPLLPVLVLLAAWCLWWRRLRKE